MSKNKFISWLPVIVFIAVAIGFHFLRTSTDNFYLLAGSDGPYLPVQVKSLFEHHRLAFADMPLLFVLCTLIAKILFFVKLGTETECILMSIRFVDTVLPTLAAIPVFYISKELFAENVKAKFSNYFLVAFSILSFTPLFAFSFQLQKNSFATIFIFSYLYYVLKILKYCKREDIIKAIVALLLCLVTHFGSFGLLLFISITIILFSLLFQKSKFQIQALKKVVGILTVFIIAFALIALFDYTRFMRIINVPFKIFEAPALLFALNGQNFILKPPNLLIVLAMNFLAIVGLIFLIRNKNQIEKYKLIFGIALGTCTIFLSNPLLGLEWASRLFMLAYIPIVILYLILYNSTSNKWLKISTLAVFALLLVLSIATSTFEKTGMSMDSSSFKELQTIKDKNIFEKSDAIVARQSLRILSNWVFETKGVDRYLLTKEEFNKYPNVYLLKQIKGRNSNARGSEPNLGDSILSVYKGEHFEVYKLTSNTQLPDKAEKIFKGIRGTIQTISGSKILVTDIKTNRPREIQVDTKNASFPKLFEGMKVEVNGEWSPFSLTIKAETIRQIDTFDDK